MRPAGLQSLPLGYTRLEYLESTRGQYINTGVELTNDSVATSRFRILNGHDYGFIFGSRYAVKVNAFCLYVDTQTWLNYGAQVAYAPVLQKNMDHDFRAQTNVWTINNKVYTLELEPAFNAGTCYIFGLNENGATDSRYFVGRVYSFSISNVSETHEFVPTLDSSGTPCMFDTVTRKPFYNSGKGSFIAGIDNQAQLDNMLRKLPNRTGQAAGTLTVRLADELKTSENLAKLDAMSSKNWTITQAV